MLPNLLLVAVISLFLLTTIGSITNAISTLTPTQSGTTTTTTRTTHDLAVSELNLTNSETTTSLLPLQPPINVTSTTTSIFLSKAQQQQQYEFKQAINDKNNSNVAVKTDNSLLELNSNIRKRKIFQNDAEFKSEAKSPAGNDKAQVDYTVDGTGYQPLGGHVSAVSEHFALAVEPTEPANEFLETTTLKLPANSAGYVHFDDEVEHYTERKNKRVDTVNQVLSNLFPNGFSDIFRFSYASEPTTTTIPSDTEVVTPETEHVPEIMTEIIYENTAELVPASELPVEPRSTTPISQNKTIYSYKTSVTAEYRREVSPGHTEIVVEKLVMPPRTSSEEFSDGSNLITKDELLRINRAAVDAPVLPSLLVEPGKARNSSEQIVILNEHPDDMDDINTDEDDNQIAESQHAAQHVYQRLPHTPNSYPFKDSDNYKNLQSQSAAATAQKQEPQINIHIVHDNRPNPARSYLQNNLFTPAAELKPKVNGLQQNGHANPKQELDNFQEHAERNFHQYNANPEAPSRHFLKHFNPVLSENANGPVAKGNFHYEVNAPNTLTTQQYRQITLAKGLNEYSNDYIKPATALQYQQEKQQTVQQQYQEQHEQQPETQQEGHQDYSEYAQHFVKPAAQLQYQQLQKQQQQQQKQQEEKLLQQQQHIQQQEYEPQRHEPQQQYEQLIEQHTQQQQYEQQYQPQQREPEQQPQPQQEPQQQNIHNHQRHESSPLHTHIHHSQPVSAAPDYQGYQQSTPIDVTPNVNAEQEQHESATPKGLLYITINPPEPEKSSTTLPGPKLGLTKPAKTPHDYVSEAAAEASQTLSQRVPQPNAAKPTGGYTFVEVQKSVNIHNKLITEKDGKLVEQHETIYHQPQYAHVQHGQQGQSFQNSASTFSPKKYVSLSANPIHVQHIDYETEHQQEAASHANLQHAPAPPQDTSAIIAIEQHQDTQLTHNEPQHQQPTAHYVERVVHVPQPYAQPIVIEKKVPAPYPVNEVVEKIVDRPVPVEKVVERPVQVPYAVPVEHYIDRPYPVPEYIEKHVHVPYPVPEPVAVPVPFDRYIDRPYPVETIVEKRIPYPVETVVEKVVEKHVPVEVERIVEKPVEKIVEKFVDRPIPVPIHVPIAIRVPVPHPSGPPLYPPVWQEPPNDLGWTSPTGPSVARVPPKVLQNYYARMLKKLLPQMTTYKTTASPTRQSKTKTAAKKLKAGSSTTPKPTYRINDISLALKPPPPPLSPSWSKGARYIYNTLPFDLSSSAASAPEQHISLFTGPAFKANEPYDEFQRWRNGHNLKRSPDFGRNLQVEYGFKPPLVPSVEIDDHGVPLKPNNE